jgi:hypothetical protein
MGLKRSLDEAPPRRIAHGQPREVRVRRNHRYRWRPSPKGWHQGLVSRLRNGNHPPSLMFQIRRSRALRGCLFNHRHVHGRSSVTRR